MLCGFKRMLTQERVDNKIMCMLPELTKSCMAMIQCVPRIPSGVSIKLEQCITLSVNILLIIPAFLQSTSWWNYVNVY